MHWIVAALGLLAGEAEPKPAAPPPQSPAAEAAVFVRELESTLSIITAMYVRPFADLMSLAEQITDDLSSFRSGEGVFLEMRVIIPVKYFNGGLDGLD